MRGSKSELEQSFDDDGISIREARWGDMHVAYGSFEKDMDVAPLLKGLPNDMCHTPHYGYVFKGEIKITYPDREEAIKAGDTYYIEPGHTGKIFAGTEYVEFSPKAEMDKTMETITKNMEAMSKGQ
jgi:hypothetical protein